MKGSESEAEKPEKNIPPLRILVVDDDPAIGASCRRILSGEGHEVVVFENALAGFQAALNGQYDLILLDLVMPGLDGIKFLRQLKTAGITSPVVIITGYATVESAVEAMKQGAADYISKPFTPEQLSILVRKLGSRAIWFRQNLTGSKEAEIYQGFEGILGQSPPMQQVFALIKRVAPTDGTVLITGESGTGKELVAQAIHRLSRRRDKPMLACDCAALAPSLLESELFGHVKGSFSGAIATKKGLFEAADGGTLFLDEIGNVSLQIQAKLLRVLETRRVKKVGDTVEREVDIRLIAATNRDLGEMVRAGLFREDLYYRLNVVPIHLPPLRDRPGDISLLANIFLRRACARMDLPIKGFTPEAMARLESYPWPGNVRELKNIIERMAILCEGDYIDVVHLPLEIRQAPVRASLPPLPITWEEFRQLKERVADSAIEELERRFVLEALRRTGGNVSQAAKQVRMLRPNFHKLMRKYGIRPEDIHSE
ncbi:MAG: sigma-54 dependent transcriptional regulator [Thermoguttaceae bacterium]|nr:sigma-54 dependent transcriptional regulator [Thermoguttaceae bacterium]MDW8037248.1 sigma-54 dependent transcriptional regulator [Thermoguttaceae bacterium]